MNIDENQKKYLRAYWRLILGKSSQSSLCASQDKMEIMNHSVDDLGDMLDFLYSNEYEEGSLYSEDSESVNDKKASKAKSVPKVLKWLREVRMVFPKKTVEIMERDALEKYKMKEMLFDKKVLESIEPNKVLLETILTLKEQMNDDVLETAKKIVKKIVDEIKFDLEKKITVKFSSLINRTKSSLYSSSGELDFIKTINKNLKNYDLNEKRIIFEDIYFYDNIRKKNKWNLILAVDESGSMMDSVLYSSVMASIFATVPFLKTKLVVFDTDVVDLTEYLDDIVKIMFSVRLGGGTDIAKALKYVNKTYLKEPSKTIVVLISDFYDWNMQEFYYEVSKIIESGAKFFALGALTEDAKGSYDKKAAKKLADIGADVAALTPDELIDWIKKVLK